MAKVISNVKLSKCRITRIGNGGVDIDFGHPIIFEYQHKWYTGYCQGWKLVDGKPVIKTDMLSDSYSRLDLPIDKVWRVRDRRDDIIEDMKQELEALRDKVGAYETFINDVRDGSLAGYPIHVDFANKLANVHNITAESEQDNG